jgi:hypothetical protein
MPLLTELESWGECFSTNMPRLRRWFTSVPSSGVCREKHLNETGWWGEHPMARSHCRPYSSDMSTLLIIVVLLVLFGGGGGYYYSRRR